ncbi:MAG: TonB family protein [Candidatus Tectomicrobia bacterium]|nr:TonB family protein [Candidatus Tectomicrobia bacterium]
MRGFRQWLPVGRLSLLAVCFILGGALGWVGGADAATVYVKTESAKIYSTAGKQSFAIRVVERAQRGAPLSVLSESRVGGALWLQVRTATGQTGWIEASETSEGSQALRGGGQAASSEAAPGAAGAAPSAATGGEKRAAGRGDGGATTSDDASPAPGGGGALVTPTAGAAQPGRPGSALPGELQASSGSQGKPSADASYGPPPPASLPASLRSRVDQLYASKQSESLDVEGISIESQDPKYKDYFASLLKLIGGKFTYPMEAFQARIEGRVYLKFVLKKDGVLRGVQVVTTSGFDVLDHAAIKAIDNAAPFPPFPPSVQSEELGVLIDFLYAPVYPEGGPKVQYGGEDLIDEARGYKKR